MEDNAKIRAAVIESVAGLSDEQLNRKLDPEKWTIAQVLVHLYLLEKGLSKGISYVLKNGEEQTVELQPLHRVPDRTIKIKAPTSVEPRDEFISLDMARAKLEQSRNALNEALTGVSDEQLENRALPHPVFGLMSLKQWVELVGLHEKRHLEQIEELKQELFEQ